MLISEKIRNRIISSKKSFLSNDNISEFISLKEKSLLIDELESRIKDLLISMIIDIDNDHNMKNSPKRIAKMYVDEIFFGRYNNCPKITTFPNVKKNEDLFTIGPIEIKSCCAHHLTPIVGSLWLGIISNKRKMLGLSKYSRIVNWIMTRPQIQEELVIQISQEVKKHSECQDICVYMKTNHLCTSWRGVHQRKEMSNLNLSGAFKKNKSLLQDFFFLIK